MTNERQKDVEGETETCRKRNREIMTQNTEMKREKERDYERETERR